MTAVTGRLIGGFRRGIDRDASHDAVADAVQGMPEDSLADLSTVASLPGLPAALIATSAKAQSAVTKASAGEANSMRYGPLSLIVQSFVALRW